MVEKSTNTKHIGVVCVLLHHYRAQMQIQLPSASSLCIQAKQTNDGPSIENNIIIMTATWKQSDR